MVSSIISGEPLFSFLLCFVKPKLLYKKRTQTGARKQHLKTRKNDTIETMKKNNVRTGFLIFSFLVCVLLSTACSESKSPHGNSVNTSTRVRETKYKTKREQSFMKKQQSATGTWLVPRFFKKLKKDLAKILFPNKEWTVQKP